MRVFILAGLFLAAGCSPMIPMAELERQALETGDWSAVEKRERMLERRGNGTAIQCPAGYISYCTERYGEATCTCMARDGFRAALSLN